MTNELRKQVAAIVAPDDMRNRSLYPQKAHIRLKQADAIIALVRANAFERAAEAVMGCLYPKNAQDDWTEFASVRAGCAVSAVAAIRALATSGKANP